jgi:hypothetical protein
MNMYRQGDVLLVPVDEVPTAAVAENEEKEGLVILAYGEVTGHHHRFKSGGGRRVRAYRMPNSEDRFVTLRGNSRLVHEEHDAISVPPGNYQVIIQEEYISESERRRVAD